MVRVRDDPIAGGNVYVRLNRTEEARSHTLVAMLREHGFLADHPVWVREHADNSSYIFFDAPNRRWVVGATVERATLQHTALNRWNKCRYHRSGTINGWMKLCKWFTGTWFQADPQVAVSTTCVSSWAERTINPGWKAASLSTFTNIAHSLAAQPLYVLPRVRVPSARPRVCPAPVHEHACRSPMSPLSRARQLVPVLPSAIRSAPSPTPITIR